MTSTATGTVTLRDQVEHWLGERRLSQAAFAKLVPISESHLSLVLDGKRPISLRKAAKISSLTGIPIEQIAEAAQ